MELSPVEQVRVPVQVVLGETGMTLEDFASLKAGSIVELDSYAGEPVKLQASGQTVAIGEVVVIDENFGIRITAVAGDSDG